MQDELKVLIMALTVTFLIALVFGAGLKIGLGLVQ